MDITTIVYRNSNNLATVLIIYIIYNTKFSDKFIKNSIQVIKVTIILTAIVSVIQVFDYHFFNASSYLANADSSEDSIYLQRRSSIFGFVGSNQIGLSFLPMGAFSIGYMIYTREKYYFHYTLLIGITAFLTNSRYVMVSFFIILIMLFFDFIYNKRNLIKYLLITALVSFFVYFFLAKVGYDFQEFSEKRLFAEKSLEETTRFRALKTFVTFFPENPFLGTGEYITEEIKEASQANQSSQIHVGYLSHLVAYGLIGSILLFGFWFFLTRRLLLNSIKSRYWGSFFAFLIFLWAQATLVLYSIFFTGLIFALIYDKYITDKDAAKVLSNDRNLTV